MVWLNIDWLWWILDRGNTEHFWNVSCCQPASQKWMMLIKLKLFVVHVTSTVENAEHAMETRTKNFSIAFRILQKISNRFAYIAKIIWPWLVKINFWIMIFFNSRTADWLFAFGLMSMPTLFNNHNYLMPVLILDYWNTKFLYFRHWTRKKIIKTLIYSKNTWQIHSNYHTLKIS